MAVLQTEQDFFYLTLAYMQRARRDGVRHVEAFFDPQAHTRRGVAVGTVIHGIVRALADVCDNTGRRDEAARFRAELATLEASTRPATQSTQPTSAKS